MAEAVEHTETVVTKTVILTLTEEETDILLAILSRVSGSPDMSARGDADNIRRALESATGKHFSYTLAYRCINGNLVCNNWEDAREKTW